MAGLSPVPRDQCSTPQLDLHVMYSTFRTQPPSTSAGKWKSMLSKSKAMLKAILNMKLL